MVAGSLNIWLATLSIPRIISVPKEVLAALSEISVHVCSGCGGLTYLYVIRAEDVVNEAVNKEGGDLQDRICAETVCGNRAKREANIAGSGCLGWRSYKSAVRMK